MEFKPALAGSRAMARLPAPTTTTNTISNCGWVRKRGLACFVWLMIGSRSGDASEDSFLRRQSLGDLDLGDSPDQTPCPFCQCQCVRQACLQQGANGIVACKVSSCGQSRILSNADVHE